MRSRTLTPIPLQGQVLHICTDSKKLWPTGVANSRLGFRYRMSLVPQVCLCFIETLTPVADIVKAVRW